MPEEVRRIEYLAAQIGVLTGDGVAEFEEERNADVESGLTGSKLRLDSAATLGESVTPSLLLAFGQASESIADC